MDNNANSSTLVKITDGIKLPVYNTVLNKLQALGSVSDIACLINPLVESLHKVDFLSTNIRLFSDESAYTRFISQVPEGCTDINDYEHNGYKVHCHSHGNVKYMYLYGKNIQLTEDCKYTSIGLKLGTKLKTNNNYHVSAYQEFDYGCFYIARNSSKCIRINIPETWTPLDKKYIMKESETSYFE